MFTPHHSTIGFFLLVSASACLLGAVALSAEDLDPVQAVFPITALKPNVRYLTVGFGTGFCLDRDCRFVGTNYHVAQAMGKFVRIQGVFSAHCYLDSGPNDAGAEDVGFAERPGSLKYTQVHDLAIYEMRRPLKHHHGIAFSVDNPTIDEAVDIYAYPYNGNPKRVLAHYKGKFAGTTQQGLLVFTYNEGHLHAGASGGIVVQSGSQKIIGILNEIGMDRADRPALAVAVQQLSDFVARTHPYLQATLFPKSVVVSPVAADFYPPLEPPALRENSPDIFKLRVMAEHLSDSMRNFGAVETFAWGQDNREADFSDTFETLIADGRQRWHRPGARKFYDAVPLPPLGTAVVWGGNWSGLAELLGTEREVNIHQAPDASLNGLSIHVFQYAASIKDGVCSFRNVSILGWWATQKFYDCHGEVWLNKSGTILRISQTMDVEGAWHRCFAVITYGWIDKDGVRYLVPVTVALEAEHKDKTYWCHGLFTDYQIFHAKVKIFLGRR